MTIWNLIVLGQLGHINQLLKHASVIFNNIMAGKFCSLTNINGKIAEKLVGGL
jgi:hypothetical protein